MIERVVYGTLKAVEAEYSLPDMGADWYKRWGHRYAVKIIGDDEYDVDFVSNAKEARAHAKSLASELNVPFTAV